ncbi:hypothetical protein D0Y65_007488 [Glycine soja]|uniref:Uncharacterized protein n=1 Tax=Glycine soja TaxID=3848 RepID=A0A445LD73_GLYSO|nr:hypothetical protein D0Y65_007488 [Glycine soja]
MWSSTISINPNHDRLTEVVKVRMHPPSASRVLLPDGRYMAYPDQGIPGVKTSLLDEYGVAWSHMIFLGLGRVILIPTGISTRQRWILGLH